MSAIGIKFEASTHTKVKLVVMSRNVSIQDYVMGLIHADLNTPEAKAEIKKVIDSLEDTTEVIVKPKHKNTKKK